MPYAPGVGTGFTSIGDYLDANKGTLAREGSDVAQQMGNDFATVQASPISSQGADYTSGKPFYDYRDQANALGTTGGVADYFQQHFGDTKPQGAFDANLFGAQPQYATQLQSWLDTPKASGPHEPKDAPLRYHPPDLGPIGHDPDPRDPWAPDDPPRTPKGKPFPEEP